MEDLVQFVKDLSPCLSKVCHDVDVRRKDLLNPYQRDTLAQHLEQVKTLAPILICSMKIFIQILSQEGKGTDEAIENRNYLAKRMTDEIGEIQRILEETSREEGAASKMANAISGGINVQEMTFHEILKRVSSSLNSQKKDHTLNQKSIQAIVELGLKIAEGFDGAARSNVIDICNELDRVNRTHGSNVNDPRTKQQMTELVRRLELTINEAVINRIIQDMADITTPLKQFTDAVLSSDPPQVKRERVDQRSHSLKIFSNKLSKTANVVAFANARNKRRAESLHHLSSQVQNLTPQLINAGTIRMNYPENKAAEENFENLRKQYAEGIQTIRDICDESIDLKIFLHQTQAHIKRSITSCEDNIRSRNGQGIVESTALTARLANRLLMALHKESENSDDPNLKRQVNVMSDRLKGAIAPFVERSKALVSNPSDPSLNNNWKDSANRLMDVVSEVCKLFDDLNMYGLDSARSNGHQIPVMVSPTAPKAPPAPAPPPAMLTETPPPRPPLPEEVLMPGRPPLPDTDDEEGLFSSEPGANRPIHQAAHGLYQEVRQVQYTHSLSLFVRRFSLAAKSGPIKVNPSIADPSVAK